MSEKTTDYAAVIASEHPVGIDIERRGKRVARVVSHFLKPDEEHAPQEIQNVANAAIDAVSGLSADDCVVFLISGGGSITGSDGWNLVIGNVVRTFY